MEDKKVISMIGVDGNGLPTIKEPIFLTLSTYNNHKYLDVRKYYSDGNELKPTKKGVTLTLEQIEQIQEIFQSNKDEIENWFK